MSKFRFTIGRRIGLGFGLLILLTIVIFILIFLNVTAPNDANEESNRLKKKIEEVYTPSLQTLNETKTQVLESKKLITIWVKSESRDEDNSVRDGMDLAMCALDRDNLELEYAGADNPLYLVRDGKIEITKADKFAVGSMTDQFYTNHKIKLKEGDKIYIFSDGYADQFGGPKGKKFMYSKFRKLILSISDKPMADQGQIFSEEIEKRKGQYEQIDDILLMGVRV